LGSAQAHSSSAGTITFRSPDAWPRASHTPAVGPAPSSDLCKLALQHGGLNGHAKSPPVGFPYNWLSAKPLFPNQEIDLSKSLKTGMGRASLNAESIVQLVTGDE
jgi:hypothetical protein